MKQIKIVAQAETKSADVYIYDVIGEDMFGGVSAKNFADQLDALGPLDTIVVHVNSPGGSVMAGNAIYNTLKMHPARKVFEIEGLAASAMSYVMMSGDEINIHENAFVMIHQAQGFAVGPESEMRKMADVLDKMDETISAVYAKRTGRKPDTMMRMMKDETWFTAKEALEAKLVDNIRPNKAKPPTVANLSALNLLSKRPERIAALFKHGNPGSAEEAEALATAVARACEKAIFIDGAGISQPAGIADPPLTEPTAEDIAALEKLDVEAKLAQYNARVKALQS